MSPLGDSRGVPSQMSMEMYAARFSVGPIPDAEELERYKAVQPDLPERIMRQFEERTEMAKAQQLHRHGLENRTVDANIRREAQGMRIAATLAVLVIGLGGVLIYLDKPTEGLVAILTMVGTLAGIFIWGRHGSIQEIAKKRAAAMIRAQQAGEDPNQLSLLPPER